MRVSLPAIALSAIAVSLVALAPARAATLDVAVIEKVTSLLTDVAAFPHTTASRLAKRADCVSCTTWANNCVAFQGKCTTLYSGCACPAPQKSLLTACFNSLVGTSGYTADSVMQMLQTFDQTCTQIAGATQAQLDALDQQTAGYCNNFGATVNLDVCKGVASAPASAPATAAASPSPAAASPAPAAASPAPVPAPSTAPAPAPAGSNTQTTSKPASATSSTVASKVVLSVAALLAVFAVFA
ncbi:hypothetical protein M427DRAFT_72584 [Gonapodya prolifera JEL478]|uniref:Extracellular membrane protein CFEM domain-containing protein n=1 Tax=Gonapodya prolifera (strain JEL478) TaxID=1344416 RepID=A0A139A4U9_GONPJ|nr:hypothetical protein M427DRAFT_72584 [Gonapodya prolifera JEL478]|eukprot:KXS11837.1 hypothetical protein M427DRAFT_72584 [Gonapodya prolifera JEL478]